MGTLSPDQRNYLYLVEAERTGVHKPILAALYAAHTKPTLPDGETGLGISPANRIPLDQVNSFAEQVQFAANTIRSLTDSLGEQGWQGADLWDAAKGRYTDRLIQTIALGYVPKPTETTAARLEACNPTQLLTAYLADLNLDFQAEQLPQNLAFLDPALLALVERLPRFYNGLPFQREALLEGVRIWRRLSTRQEAIATLTPAPATTPVATDSAEVLDESYLDQPLLQFIQRVPSNYGGLPFQREAILRSVQLWRQLDSREAAIASLSQTTSPEGNLEQIDPALIAFVQRIPQFYQSKGEQRNALTETFRVWRNLDSRAAALLALGISPDTLTNRTADPNTLANAAAQLDQALLAFIQRVPGAYKQQPQQRDSLIRLVQLWRNLPTREAAMQSLIDDIKRMERARKDTPEAPPAPIPITFPSRPARWTPANIQLHAAIITNGNFTWAEATHGGTRMPPDQATVDGIVRIAKLAQQARDRVGRPFHITSWYRPPEINRAAGGASVSRHIVGDAIDFWVDGLTGDQIYWALDPWWTGGLGRYAKFPYLCHIDARGWRARWTH